MFKIGVYFQKQSFYGNFLIKIVFFTINRFCDIESGVNPRTCNIRQHTDRYDIYDTIPSIPGSVAEQCIGLFSERLSGDK